MFLTIYDINKDSRSIYSGPLPLTPNSKLKWFGFS